jgi:hypothetical protein
MRREYVGREYLEAWEALFDGLRNLFEDFKLERATERDVEGVVDVGIAFPARRAGLKRFGDISMPRVSSSGPRVRPGSSGRLMIEWARCVCGSTPPGTTILPDASITVAASVGSESLRDREAICSPMMPMSKVPTPCGVTTWPFFITMSNMARG